MKLRDLLNMVGGNSSSASAYVQPVADDSELVVDVYLKDGSTVRLSVDVIEVPPQGESRTGAVVLKIAL